ncbi:hypothetical protein Sango_2156100 [Sesamum angolense]|uniref:Uncharacterized protein n=1 Tax=Sesamum angolense TaxID=2727404 RepID=A0AAE1WCP1_9LAMI|nr:hypothetical protein Sango_2156100 [Sesamum angolense]
MRWEFAVGLCISHRILDGTALSTFLKSWATAASSSAEKLVSPDFSASSLFPDDGLWLKDASMAMWGALFKKGQFVTRRFVFDGSAIASLKDMAMAQVERVSLHVWRSVSLHMEWEWLHLKRDSSCRRPSLLHTHIVTAQKGSSKNFSESPRQPDLADKCEIHRRDGKS